ncbi:hypothetical protein IWX91DRAFT_404752 [Phyllosticta citricarpa]
MPALSSTQHDSDQPLQDPVHLNATRLLRNYDRANKSHNQPLDQSLQSLHPTFAPVLQSVQNSAPKKYSRAAASVKCIAHQWGVSENVVWNVFPTTSTTFLRNLQIAASQITLDEALPKLLERRRARRGDVQKARLPRDRSWVPSDVQVLHLELGNEQPQNNKKRPSPDGPVSPRTAKSSRRTRRQVAQSTTSANMASEACRDPPVSPQRAPSRHPPGPIIRTHPESSDDDCDQARLNADKDIGSDEDGDQALLNTDQDIDSEGSDSDTGSEGSRASSSDGSPEVEQARRCNASLPLEPIDDSLFSANNDSILSSSPMSASKIPKQSFDSLIGFPRPWAKKRTAEVNARFLASLKRDRAARAAANRIQLESSHESESEDDAETEGEHEKTRLSPAASDHGQHPSNMASEISASPASNGIDPLRPLISKSMLDDVIMRQCLSLVCAAPDWHCINSLLTASTDISLCGSTMLALDLNFATYNHWCLVVLHAKHKEAEIYDSASCSAHLNAANTSLRQLFSCRIPEQRWDEWRLIQRNAVQQDDESDSGVHVLVFALYLRAKIAMPPAISTVFWRHMLYTLLSESPSMLPDDTVDLSGLSPRLSQGPTSVQDAMTQQRDHWKQVLQKLAADGKSSMARQAVIAANARDCSSAMDTLASELSSLQRAATEELPLLQVQIQERGAVVTSLRAFSKRNTAAEDIIATELAELERQERQLEQDSRRYACYVNSVWRAGTFADDTLKQKRARRHDALAVVGDIVQRLDDFLNGLQSA